MYILLDSIKKMVIHFKIFFYNTKKLWRLNAGPDKYETYWGFILYLSMNLEFKLVEMRLSPLWLCGISFSWFHVMEFQVLSSFAKSQQNTNKLVAALCCKISLAFWFLLRGLITGTIMPSGLKSTKKFFQTILHRETILLLHFILLATWK